jgi:hypothetical protein
MKEILLCLITVVAAITFGITLGFRGFRTSIQPRCEKMLTGIYGIAWSDPDAFDMDHVFETGTGYMCTVTNYSPLLTAACDSYMAECR